MNINAPALSQETTMRYLTDVEFFAQVDIALQLTNWECRRATGLDMTEDAKAMVIQAAAFALMAKEMDLTEGVLEDAERGMVAKAEQLGFTAVKQHVEEA